MVLYSNSDLQQIVYDDVLLLNLLKTYEAVTTTVHSASLFSGSGFVYDTDKNSYQLEFNFSEKHKYIAIGKAVRNFETIEEYRIWSNLIESYSIHNLDKKYYENELAQSKKSFLKFIKNFY